MTDRSWRAIRHSLGTELNTISGYCQLLLTETYGAVSREQSEVMEKILHSCRELTRLIDQVSDDHSPRLG